MKSFKDVFNLDEETRKSFLDEVNRIREGKLPETTTSQPVATAKSSAKCPMCGSSQKVVLNDATDAVVLLTVDLDKPGEQAKILFKLYVCAVCMNAYGGPNEGSTNLQEKQTN